MDCGAACILMIIRFYGKSEYTLDYVQQLCAVGRQGVSLLGIARASEIVGFKSLAGKNEQPRGKPRGIRLIKIDDLKKKAVLPCILHWDQNHFVVLYRKKRKGKYIFYIADPARGNVQYKETEFENHWLSLRSKRDDKGVGLLLEPTTLFYSKQHYNDKSSTGKNQRIHFLWKYFSPYKPYFAQLIIGLQLQ